jgi:hypothetical protein
MFQARFLTRKRKRKLPSSRTVCECTEQGQVLSCSDTSATCQSSFCNANGTSCARTTDYGYTFDKDGTPVSWSSTLTYASGREDDVVVEQSLVDFTCQVSVNGEPCRSCAPITCCGNGLESYAIVCDNVVGAGSTELCGGSHQEEGTVVRGQFLICSSKRRTHRVVLQD